MPHRLALIAAVAENRVIGRAGSLPWRLRSDMRYFRERTMGCPVIMGRKTWESVFEKAGKPLEGRQNVVVSARGISVPKGVVLAASANEAHQEALASLCGREGAGATIWVIGGARLYEDFMEKADSLYLTEVHARPEGDAFFPDFDKLLFRESSRARHEASSRDEFPFSFVVWERRSRVRRGGVRKI